MSDKFYDEFYRQRRNLILISVVLFFVVSSGLNIHKIDVWGNELELKNPDGIVSFLWVIWAYWVWRFGVYCLGYGDGFVRIASSSIRNFFQNKHYFAFKKNYYSLRETKLAFGKCESFFDPSPYKQNLSPHTEVTKGLVFYRFAIQIIVTIIISHKSFNDQIFPFIVALLPVTYVALK
jgi:hypothetical protein